MTNGGVSAHTSDFRPELPYCLAPRISERLAATALRRLLASVLVARGADPEASETRLSEHGENMRAVRTRAIHPGDIVLVNKGGRIFYAKVVGAGATAGLVIEPITRNITYRQIRASEIADHWSHQPGTRRADRVTPAQTELELPEG